MPPQKSLTQWLANHKWEYIPEKNKTQNNNSASYRKGETIKTRAKLEKENYKIYYEKKAAKGNSTRMNMNNTRSNTTSGTKKSSKSTRLESLTNEELGARLNSMTFHEKSFDDLITFNVNMLASYEKDMKKYEGGRNDIKNRINSNAKIASKKQLTPLIDILNKNIKQTKKRIAILERVKKANPNVKGPLPKPLLEQIRREETMSQAANNSASRSQIFSARPPIEPIMVKYLKPKTSNSSSEARLRESLQAQNTKRKLAQLASNLALESTIVPFTTGASVKRSAHLPLFNTRDVKTAKTNGTAIAKAKADADPALLDLGL